MKAKACTQSLRWALPLALVLGLAAFFALGLERFASFPALADNRDWLLSAVARHRAVAAVAFIGLYSVSAALSVPGGSFLTIAGGFLFGALSGAACVVLGASIGATVLFLIARSALGAGLRARAGGLVDRLAAGFARNALGYMLFLRLVPLFPFWLVNLAPAFLGVPLRSFIVGTVIGIIPGTLVYASIGAGLGGLLDRGQAPDLHVIFAPRILVPMLALALLALVPAAWERLARGAEPKPQHRG